MNKINSSSSSKNYSTINSTKNKCNSKYFSPQIKLPFINQNNNDNNLITKIKKSSLSKSISFLYKTLFPDQKQTLDEFLDNYSYDKFLKKPHWKYTFYPLKEEAKIKQYIMVNNKEMKFYNNIKKPCKIKVEYKRKPRMVEIIEDNYIYKHRDNKDNPFAINFNFLNKNKSAIKLGENKAKKDENYNGGDK